MKHIVTVTYSDPGHEFISLRGRTKSTNYVVEARDVPEAQNRASSYFRSMGYKIHSAVVNEQKMENLSEGSSAAADAEYRASLKNDAIFPSGKPDPAVARSIENAPAEAEKARRAANAENAARRAASAAALKAALVPKSSSPPPSSQITKQNGVVPKGSSLSGLKKEETQYIEEKLKVSDGVDAWKIGRAHV